MPQTGGHLHPSSPLRGDFVGLLHFSRMVQHQWGFIVTNTGARREGQCGTPNRKRPVLRAGRGRKM
jgi:hypothetical protein